MDDRSIEPVTEARAARLEQALAEERRTSEELRGSLAELAAKIDRLEAAFTRRLAEAQERTSAAEAKLKDQQVRLEALGSGRAETMRALAEARAELERVRAERDALRRQAEQADAMHTATIALPDEPEPVVQQPMPSIEELMASLASFTEPGSADDNAQAHVKVRDEPAAADSQELISPEIVFPERYDEHEPHDTHDDGPASRLLVLLDADQPVKYPLTKDVMTIGRGDTADIHINSDFVSRVHARLVSTPAGVIVEDVGSKNGIKVNARLTARTTLRHGDVLSLGRLRFTYLETRA